MKKNIKSIHERKLTLQLILAVCMSIFGCFLIIAAFIIPPTGEIHASVLAAFGEILTFAGAVMGIDYSYKFKSKTQSHDPTTEEGGET